jgi:hypothetical protein
MKKTINIADSTNNKSAKIINKEVSVTSVYFRPGPALKGYPKRMEYEGREYTFIESGLRYLVRKGQEFFEVFDMTDGERDYRLKFEGDRQVWTLIGVKGGDNAFA